jgi:hypothetical protein
LVIPSAANDSGDDEVHDPHHDGSNRDGQHDDEHDHGDAVPRRAQTVDPIDHGHPVVTEIHQSRTASA